MTQWYCDRCGNKIHHKSSNCPKCNKIIYWEDNGNWLFKSYFPKGIDAMTNEEVKELREQWYVKLKKIYKDKGMFPYLKFKLFGEGNTADRRRRRATTEEMAEVFRRYGHKCVNPKCQSEHNLTVDHIIPLAKGGTWDMDNLQLMCQSCNSSKGVKV